MTKAPLRGPCLGVQTELPARFQVRTCCPRKGRVLMDSSHDKARAFAGLATRSKCRNRDRLITARSHRASTSPTPLGSLVAPAPTSVGAERAARAQKWRAWIERAGQCAVSTPMWTSRRGWVRAVSRWVHSPRFARLCATVPKGSIEAATLLAIAAVMAEHADHSSGRHVAVTRARIAERVGCSPDTVTVAWRVLRAAGWAVEAQRGHGSPHTPQHGRRPSVYHCVPRKGCGAVHNPDLPPKAGVCLLSSVGKYSPSARTARAGEKSFKKRRPYRAEPRPLPVQRLAAELVDRSHGLAQTHIGAICDAITAAGIDPAVWSARAITDALDTDMRARGWSWPDRIERPGAFLASRLRRLDWAPKSGGTAAASLEGKAAVPAVPLTTAQRARIAAARAEIRAVLRRRVTADPTPEAPKSAQRRRPPVKATSRCAVGQAEP